MAHPEIPPESLQSVRSAVLARLPGRENIKKRIQRERLIEMPANPKNIADLYQKVLEASNGFGHQFQQPEHVICDFKLAIINSVWSVDAQVNQVINALSN